MNVRKAFQYRLFPTKHQATLMQRTLEECRWLYNHLLETRKTNWEERHESLTLYSQHATLPSLKRARPALATVHSQVLQNVAVRIDLAFKAYFRRVKAGEKPGYPRFRGYGRYDSFCYPQAPSGCKLDGSQLTLSGIGPIRVRLHRPLSGKVKTCCIRRSSTGKWYVSFSCQVVAVPLPESAEVVGIDVGLTHFAALSTGETIENPRFFRSDEAALAKVQRRFSKEAKGTPERRSRRKPVARVHERIAWRRQNFAHQESCRIVNRFQVIAVEDLTVNQMLHNHCLAKSISDAAWTSFASMLAAKAESAGRSFVAVNPAYTTQTCSTCGHRQRLGLAERIYRCSCCGLELDRDFNASLNIKALGLESAGLPREAPGFSHGE